MSELQFSSDFFDDGSEIARITFSGGAWVDVRKHLTVAERNEMMQEARRLHSRREIDPRTRQGNVVQIQEFDLVAMRMALLKAIIVAWSSSRPVNDENIAAMPEPMAVRIQAQYDRWNPEEDSEEGKASAPASAATSVSGAGVFPMSSVG